MADDSYFTIGGWLGAFASVCTFLISWFACLVGYGFLGFGLGWIPSLILAAVVFLLVKFLWGIILPGAALLALYAWR